MNVTVRCVVCGIEITGKSDAEGSVRPTNHPVRTEPVDGYCMIHADSPDECPSCGEPWPCPHGHPSVTI